MNSRFNLFHLSFLVAFCTATTSLPAGNFLHRHTQDNALDSCVRKDEPEEKIAIKKAADSLASINPTAPRRYPIVLTTADGLTRQGTLVLRENARGVIVMCHPAAYDQTFFIPYEEKVFSYYHCIRFDFRRHGQNREGQCSTIGKKEIYEVEAAVNYVKNHPATKNLPIYGFGVSMGAAVLIEAENQKHQFDGLILQSTFESLREQVRRTFPIFDGSFASNFIFREPVRAYAKFRYGIRLCKVYPERSIQNIHTPIFLMHAKNDPVIEFKAYLKLKKAGEKCITQTWEPEKGRHTELLKTFPEMYVQKCNGFLNKLAMNKLKKSPDAAFTVAENKKKTPMETQPNKKATYLIASNEKPSTTMQPHNPQPKRKSNPKRRH